MSLVMYLVEWYRIAKYEKREMEIAFWDLKFLCFKVGNAQRRSSGTKQ